MPRHAPQPRTPTPTPTAEIAQPPGSLPPLITDSPLGTPRSSRPLDATSSAARGGRCVSPRLCRGARPNSTSNGGAGFRDKLEALSATHDSEVAGLREKVLGLEDLVVRYQSLLDEAQGGHKKALRELLCSPSGGLVALAPVQKAASEVCSGYVLNDSSGSKPRTSFDPAQNHATAPKPAPSGVDPPTQDPSELPGQISSQAAAMSPAARRTVVDSLKRRRKKTRIKNSSQTDNNLTCLQRVVDHMLFDMLCAFMIINNSIIIGFEVQWLTTSDTEPEWTKIVGLLCFCFFFVELVIRVLADGVGCFFVFSENRNWNWFDFFLVTMSFVDFMALSGGDGLASVIGKGFKTIKMLRIIRVVRVFRFFNKLSQLAFMIVDSVKSLVWALIMLAIVIYVFAIFFTHYTSDHVRLNEMSDTSVLIREHFANLGMTVFTLFHCMLNGVSWYRIPSALYTIPGWTGPLLALGFVGYLSFTMLAVMNIITGVFVDNAVETARTQREFLVQKEMEVKEQWLKEMRKIFLEMDADSSGTVSKDEVNEFCNDDRVQYYLTALGLDVQDTEKLFDLLDEDNDGELELDEFLGGCLRLKGMARSIDVYSLYKLTASTSSTSHGIAKRLEDIERVLRENLPSLPATRGHRALLTKASLQEPQPRDSSSVDARSVLGLQAWDRPDMPCVPGSDAEGRQAWSADVPSVSVASGALRAGSVYSQPH
ncbi:unnamed protein product [Prorocentrum cordatum]|uniref:EF-hand domain-containing protein n=1 Tax=Prorocentrum cordatum TaxID=2364126 RepID=A0ABN9WG34_9DINO|nr:unnamed protein product [Polarella glacialis]